MSHMHECLIRSRSDAHALSPLVYELRSIITAHLHRGPGSAQGPGLGPGSAQGPGLALDHRLLHAEWALLECKLLWKKGLLSAARDNLMTLVVHPLQPLVDTHRGSGLGLGLGRGIAQGFGLGGRGIGKRIGLGRSGGSDGDGSGDGGNVVAYAMSDLLSNALRTGGEVGIIPSSSNQSLF